MRRPTRWQQWLLVAIAIASIVGILLVPLLLIVLKAFSQGLEVFLHNLGERDMRRAITLTLVATTITVPTNAIFGILLAWCVTQYDFHGRGLLTTLINVPFAMSPIVAGLCYLLLYGIQSGLGRFLSAHNINVMFAWPGIVLVTIFVTCPYVARLLIPLMQQQGSSEAEAALLLGANGWQIFWKVTLPNIRWALLYGVIMTNARAVGEFGAVSVVSGTIRGKTLTLPLHIELLHQDYNTVGAFAAAILLTSFALITLASKFLLEARQQGLNKPLH